MAALGREHWFPGPDSEPLLPGRADGRGAKGPALVGHKPTFRVFDIGLPLD